jgi:hypothetical protein
MRMSQASHEQNWISLFDFEFAGSKYDINGIDL